MSSFRITTNGMFRQYRAGLNKSSGKLNQAMIGVETHRKFTSYAEDPAAASQAFQRRRSVWRTDNQITNSNYIISKFQTGWSALEEIVDGTVEHPGLDGIESSLRGLNGATAGGRKSLGQDLLSTANGILQSMNAQYGSNYVFSGNDGKVVPLSWGEDGELLYRGVPVSNSILAEGEMIVDAQGNIAPPAQLDEAQFTQKYVDENYSDSYANAYISADKGGDLETVRDEYIAANQADYDAYKAERPGVADADIRSAYVAEHDAEIRELYRSDPAREDAIKAQFQTDNEKAIKTAYEEYKTEYRSAQALVDMVNETTYIDIGLGMREMKNTAGEDELMTSSAYNSALSALTFLGYGVDEDGDSKNIAVLMKELGTIYNKCDPEDGTYANEGDDERAEVLVRKLRDAISRVSEQHVKLDADTKYLKTNLKQLTLTRDTLNEQVTELEDVDPAKAIGDMLYAQYCYNAALKIGTNILSESLIDYMR